MFRARFGPRVAIVSAVLALIAAGTSAVSAQASVCPQIATPSLTCTNSSCCPTPIPTPTPTDPDALPPVPADDWNASSDGPLAPAATTSSNPLVASRLASAPAALTTTDTTDTGAAGELDGLTPQAQTNLATAATTTAATTLTSSSTWYFIYLTGYSQERSNWCGPAAARTMLSTWMTSPPSQSALATQMQTNSLGFTGPAYMSKALNQRINVAYPGFGTAYTTYRSITNQDLWDGVTRYHRDEVWGLTVRSRAIWYPSAPSVEAHYLVIYGYSNNYRGVPAYIVWDPVPKSQGGGVHTIAKADWQRVAYPGQFVVAPSYG